ncbi:hypothetical protein AHAS_Ahas11G0213500 [Arachis hypogaea]
MSRLTSRMWLYVIYSTVLTTLLDSIKEFSASVYTRAVFVDVKKEIEVVSLVNFVRVQWSLTTKVYTVEEYGHLRRHVVVLCDKNMERLECDCYFCDTCRFLCKHMFFMMKHEHFTEVSKRLVLKRCMKHAKSLDDYVEKTSDNGDREFLLPHGILYSTSYWLFFLRAQKFDLFMVAMKGIQELCMKLEYVF